MAPEIELIVVRQGSGDQDSNYKSTACRCHGFHQIFRNSYQHVGPASVVTVFRGAEKQPALRRRGAGPFGRASPPHRLKPHVVLLDDTAFRLEAEPLVGSHGI